MLECLSTVDSVLNVSNNSPHHTDFQIILKYDTFSVSYGRFRLICQRLTIFMAILQ